MNETEYLVDSQKLIRMSLPHIGETMTYEQVIQAMTFYSFGMERLLKHILFKINPVFILKNGDFRNSAPCLYKDSFITSDKNEQVTKKPDTDVISFRVAMQRALLFSNAVQNNKQLIYSLAHYRDILAHRPTSEIGIKKANILLARDGVSLVSEICEEIAVLPSTFFGKHYSKLEQLSIVICDKENFELKMSALLDKHSSVWENQKSDKNLELKAKEQTKAILSSSGHDFSYEEFTCPACSNTAVVRIEPDYDVDKAEKTTYVVGVFIENIKCFYCGLELSDYDELNYVNANSIFEAYADG